MVFIPTSCIVLAFTLITQVDSFCQKPGETKYFVPNETGTFFEAIKGCKDKWATLITMDNKNKANDIKTQLRESMSAEGIYWTSGISYWAEKESKWIWHSTGQDVPDDIWCPRQPNEPNGSGTYKEPCQAVHFTRANELCGHDYPCFVPLKYICEVTVN